MRKATKPIAKGRAVTNLGNYSPPRVFVRSKVTASPLDERRGGNEERTEAYFWVRWSEAMRKATKPIAKGRAVTNLADNNPGVGLLLMSYRVFQNAPAA